MIACCLSNWFGDGYISSKSSLDPEARKSKNARLLRSESTFAYRRQKELGLPPSHQEPNRCSSLCFCGSLQFNRTSCRRRSNASWPTSMNLKARPSLSILTTFAPTSTVLVDSPLRRSKLTWQLSPRLKRPVAYTNTPFSLKSLVLVECRFIPVVEISTSRRTNTRVELRSFFCIVLCSSPSLSHSSKQEKARDKWLSPHEIKKTLQFFSGAAISTTLIRLLL